MASQALAGRMAQTADVHRLRFQLVAAEFLARMGARIRARRDELGLSRADVARQMPGKVSENQLYRWENGQHQPHPDTLEALAKVLKCDVADFVAVERSKGKTPDPISRSASAKLDRIAEQVSELYELLLGGDADAAAVAELAARLLRAAGLPQQPVGVPPRTPAAARRRRSA